MEGEVKEGRRVRVLYCGLFIAVHVDIEDNLGRSFAWLFLGLYMGDYTGLDLKFLEM